MRMRVNDIISANPYDGDYKARVEYIFRNAPETSRQLEVHLQRAPQHKAVVIDCVNSIFHAIIKCQNEKR